MEHGGLGLVVELLGLAHALVHEDVEGDEDCEHDDEGEGEPGEDEADDDHLRGAEHDGLHHELGEEGHPDVHCDKKMHIFCNCFHLSSSFISPHSAIANQSR